MELTILILVILIAAAMLYSGMPWGTSRYVRTTTQGSKKWESGLHNAGCVLHAPDGVCICEDENTSQNTERLSDKVE